MACCMLLGPLTDISLDWRDAWAQFTASPPNPSLSGSSPVLTTRGPGSKTIPFDYNSVLWFLANFSKTIAKHRISNPSAYAIRLQFRLEVHERYQAEIVGRGIHVEDAWWGARGNFCTAKIFPSSPRSQAAGFRKKSSLAFLSGPELFNANENSRTWSTLVN